MATPKMRAIIEIEFYPRVKALQQAVAFCDAVVYQAFFKETEDVGDRFLDKTLFFADADRTARAGACIDLLHPFGYHTSTAETDLKLSFSLKIHEPKL